MIPGTRPLLDCIKPYLLAGGDSLVLADIMPDKFIE